VGHNVSFDRACVESEYSLAGTKTRRMDAMSLRVAVNGPRGTSGRRKEKPKMCRGLKVEAMVDLIAQTKEEEAQARE
jgi:DNA polymerase gamma 1